MFALIEVIWILRGRNDSKFVNDWNSQLPKYAGDGKVYHGAYGHRLRQHLEQLDQLNKVYLTLKHNPPSRQAVLQIWDSAIDLPDVHGQPKAPDIPCNLTAMLTIRDGKLEWSQVARSNDLIRGVPYNFIQFTSLQEIIAGWLGVELGKYFHFANSLHIYEKDIDDFYAEYSENSIPHFNESLGLPFTESEEVFSNLEQIVVELTSTQLTLTSIKDLIGKTTLPRSYQNMLYIIAAEAARKRKWLEYSNEVAEYCTNPMLKAVWGNWVSRLSSLKVTLPRKEIIN